MNISKTEQDGAIVFSLDGWLDANTSPELGEEIERVETAKELVLDFEKVEYLSSAGLRQVVAAHRKAKELGAAFSVTKVGTEVMSIFKLTALDKKMNIQPR